jgi:hypothetical protein
MSTLKYLKRFCSPGDSYDSVQDFSNIVILWLDWLAMGRAEDSAPSSRASFPASNIQLLGGLARIFGGLRLGLVEDNSTNAAPLDLWHRRAYLSACYVKKKTAASRHLACAMSI